MGILDEAVDISELGQRNFWVLWGKSSTGKTEIGSTFPKPMLYVQIGDDGSNTIAGKEGIKAMRCESPDKLKKILTELKTDKKYKSVFIDTFSMLTQVWTDLNVVKKKRRMTQQSWGDLKIDTEELIRMAWELSEKKIVILSCHEAQDSIEGMEDEILPEVRPNVSKGARTYLEGMANYGIHTTKFKKVITNQDGEEVEIIKYGAHIGANPYYWTKFQVSKDIKLPRVMINPTYNKIMKLIKGGNE